MNANTATIWFKMLKAAIFHPRRLPHFTKILRSASRNKARLSSKRNGERQTVLISLVEHMGDIVAAEPVARYARRQFPSASIGWVMRKPYQSLSEGLADVDDVVIVTCLTEWNLLSSHGLADVEWDLHLGDRQCTTCGFNIGRPGPSRRFTHKNYYDFGNLLAVNCLVAGIPIIDAAPRLEPAQPASDTVDDLALPPSFVVIHAKSNEDRRDWTVDKWERLVAWINEGTQLPVYEIGTEAHVARVESAGLRSLCGKLSILETAEVLRRATLFIGIDSGPAHLANATAVPGVVLLGRYADFAAYTPYSGGYADGSLADLVRSAGPAASITVDTVKEAVGKRLRSVRLTADAESSQSTIVPN